MPLLTKPLGRQERQAVTLRRQGLTNIEIAVIMDRSGDHVGVVLSNAKRKGAVFPPIKRGNRKDLNCVPTARLVKIRSELLRAGYSPYGMIAIIAERTGLTKNCVKVRLWKHDHKPQGEQAA